MPKCIFGMLVDRCNMGLSGKRAFLTHPIPSHLPSSSLFSAAFLWSRPKRVTPKSRQTYRLLSAEHHTWWAWDDWNYVVIDIHNRAQIAVQPEGICKCYIVHVCIMWACWQRMQTLFFSKCPFSLCLSLCVCVCLTVMSVFPGSFSTFNSWNSLHARQNLSLPFPLSDS